MYFTELPKIKQVKLHLKDKLIVLNHLNNENMRSVQIDLYLEKFSYMFAMPMTKLMQEIVFLVT